MTANSLNHCPLLGFDPGRDKCGVAVMGDGGEVLEAQVVPSDRALDTLKDWANRFQITTLIIGDRTTSREWQTQIRQQLPQLTIITVNEQNSTLEARDRYWRLHPPRGFSRLIPQGLRLPPRPIDDIVAILLIERYLSLP
ncbi:pre-16S rRNA-processing nuclease YqgF [Sodalinema gerasimenkoae]|uniref:pre-16S rRNA-processing nuclease YqgF n=1 Tax=Sodalinema gerasimenkoae TaxID=2862348 RepID=UPI00135BB561|nr:pre-16S rRNA-processing nuclease YqgF [Sodalinema gerasimenkoae]